MFSCKQVSKALTEEDLHTFPWWKRVLVKFHVKTCIVCGKYNRQVITMQDTAHAYREHEEHLPSSIGLPDSCKQKIDSEVKKACCSLKHQ